MLILFDVDIDIIISRPVWNDTKVIQIDQVCTELDTFITLNISTDTKKSDSQKYPPPPTRYEWSLILFVVVTRDLTEELEKKSAALS